MLVRMSVRKLCGCFLKNASSVRSLLTIDRLQQREYLSQGKLSAAHEFVCRAIVERYRVSICIEHVAVREHYMAEETRELIGLDRPHQRLVGDRQQARGVIEVKETGSEAIAIVLVRAVIDFEPAPVSLDRRRARPDPCRIPMSRTCAQQTTVVAPVQSVWR